ncbi:3600_t:CDS:2 [Funneliformis mosseae]|uniref:3600_t:CDS:1 n=1 Tax=Funneliformis mosseae TaxID=27381 RepID=A0A9N8VEY1_FUNMO|nr:3600_t:CDS:2 [Funneliformis mosseae]
MFIAHAMIQTFFLYTGTANISYTSFISVSSTRSISTRIEIVQFQKECQTVTIIETCDEIRKNLMKKQNGINLLYVLAKGITLEDYEERVDKFNIHKCLEWSNGKVIIYELPSELYKVCIKVINSEIIENCLSAKWTNTKIYRAYVDISTKEADDSFRPKKLAVTSSNESNGKLNLIVEVLYSETIDHVTEKVHDYWLCLDRVHNAIVVKIDPIQQGQIPSRMKAWYYCISNRRTRNTLPVRTKFEFDT